MPTRSGRCVAPQLGADRVGELVDQRGRRLPALRRERVEAGGAAGQLLGVARQLESRVDAVADGVGEVVDDRGWRDAWPDPRSAARRRPRRGDAVVLVAARRQRREPGTLGKKAAADDARRQVGVASLQETARPRRRSRGSVGASARTRHRRRRSPEPRASRRSGQHARRARRGSRGARTAPARGPPASPPARAAACRRRNPVRYAVAGYGVLSWTIGAVSSKTRIGLTNRPAAVPVAASRQPDAASR